MLVCINSITAVCSEVLIIMTPAEYVSRSASISTLAIFCNYSLYMIIQFTEYSQCTDTVLYEKRVGSGGSRGGA